jgi:hypothetical protein
VSALPRPAVAALTAADAAMRGWGLRSLAPDREDARPLVATCAAIASPHDEPATLVALAEALAEISAAQVHGFPDNLCCDFDFLAASLLREARAAADPPATLAARGAQVCRLQRLYGRGTAINFRYVHDFVYGYDWAKWVGRDPATRAGVRPFDAAFLEHMELRGHELLTLIREDDPTYGRLPEGQDRNPFPFSREPAAELALHRELARRGEIPVPAWDPDAQPVWDRPYAALRVTCAGALGLLHGQA